MLKSAYVSMQDRNKFDGCIRILRLKNHHEHCGKFTDCVGCGYDTSTYMFQAMSVEGLAFR